MAAIGDKEKNRENFWKYSLIVFIVVIGFMLLRQAQPFMNGILGALTLFIMLRKPTYRLSEKTGKPTLAVTIVVACVTVFIIVPLSLLVWLLVAELQKINWDPQALVAPAMHAIDIVREKTQFDLLSDKNISFLASKITVVGQYIMVGIGDFFMNIFVAVFLLFFMLSGGRKMEAYVRGLLPFSERNKRNVVERINVMVRSNAIGIPLLAVIQGIIAWIGYLFLGVPNSFLAALFTGLASVVPVVGTMLVWVPLAVYFFIVGNWVNGLILLAFGAIVISQCDNLIRFILQKKMADTHPLITVFGVVAGLPVFGFMGIIFGPLLVSLFLLFLDILRKEYLTD